MIEVINAITAAALIVTVFVGMGVMIREDTEVKKVIAAELALIALVAVRAALLAAGVR